jgi:hypothetical protein
MLGTMDPNSQHQLWSRWTFVIVPGGTKRPEFAQVKHAAAVFGRIKFGSATEMRILAKAETGPQNVVRTVYYVDVRSERHPVHDPQFVQWMTDEWARWAVRGFGNGTTCTCTLAKLEAGDKQDGSPRDQLILLDAATLPSIH